MRRLVLCLTLVALAGCGTARPEKIQFSELFPPSPDAPTEGPELPVQKTAQKEKRTRVGAIRSKKLRAALTTFISRARALRTGARGQPFPAQALKNWLGALDAVD